MPDLPIKPGQPNVPAPQVSGKPFVYQFVSPALSDKILSVLKDSRMGGFSLPKQGDAYDGPDAAKFDGFMFATAKPVEQSPGWWTLYYLNERANSDAFNFKIDFPYVDHSYPRYTRSYVFLRTSVVEPTSDEVDPVFDGSDTSLPTLLLTDHTQTRLEDPILDALFVGVTRVYERLPGPVITSYGQNEKKQVVTTDTQAVETDTLPVSDAFTESLKIERENTAKATVIRSTVPDVWPADDKTTNWGSAFRDPLPLEFRKTVPLRTSVQIVLGAVVVQPMLGSVLSGDGLTRTTDLTANETKVTEFTKSQARTQYDIVHTEIDDERLSPEGQTVLIRKILDPGQQIVEEGALIVSSHVENAGDGSTIKIQETVDSVFDRQERSIAIPNLLPPEFEGLIPKTTEAETVAGGSVFNPPVLGEGEIEHKEIRTGLFIKRIEITKRDLTSLPKTLIDKKLTEEYGGGILDIVRTVDDTVLEPEEGYDVVSSFVKNLGDGLMIRETERVEGGIWPTLYGIKTIDEGIFAGLKIGYDKTVVPASEGVILPSGFTDIETHDKWRSIRISSRIDLTAILNHSLDIVEPVTPHIDLPPTLIKIIGNWSNFGEMTEEANDAYLNSGKATVTASTGAEGSIGLIHRGGYKGVANGTLVRTFYIGEPPDVPQATNIITSSGYATMRFGHGNAAQSNGKLFASSGNGGRISRETLQIGGFLTAGYTVENATFTPPEGAASASSGPYHAMVLFPGPICSMDVHIDPSPPASLPSGTQILYDVRIIHWRFGVTVMEVTYVVIP